MEHRSIQDWASIAEIAGAVAVVVSLIYVGFGLRENTRAVEAQTRQAFAAQDLAFFESGLDRTVVARAMAKLQSGEALSELERSQLETRQNLNFRIFEHAHYQYQKGTLEQSEWNRYARIIKLLCSHRPAQSMWEKDRESYSSDFRQIVDEINSTC